MDRFQDGNGRLTGVVAESAPQPAAACRSCRLAIGTAISTYVGVAYYLGLARGRAREQGFLKALPKLNDFKTLIRVSLPSGTQTCLMALGYNMLYWIYGELGTLEVAASNVVINILLVAMLPAIGLGLASASLVGQALGRGDVEDARRWGWDVVKVAVVMLFFIGAPMWLATKEILGFFLQNPETIELAYTPLILIGAFAWLDGIGAVLMNSIIGAGDSRRALLLSVSMQWGLFLPGAYLVGVEWGTGLVGCWVANIVWRGLQALVFVAQWRSNAWTRVKV